jgi:hypothetical protein
MNANKKCNCGCIEAERRDLNGDMKNIEQKITNLKKKNKVPENKMFLTSKIKVDIKSKAKVKPKSKKKLRKNY